MLPSAEDLLKTYIGERSSERVLEGQTKRGEGEKIHAVIWLCDLRDSTRLSEKIPMEDFFRSLNEQRQAGADLVQTTVIGAAANIPVAGHHCNPADVVHRSLGVGARYFRDHRCDPAAQRD
jgi:hypothetical protein